MNCVWYRRSFSVPEEYLKKRVLIHFGAVDYHATVYINGERIGEHKGGYSSFCFDITANIKKVKILLLYVQLMIREADVSQRESNLQNTAAIIAFIQEPREFGRRYGSKPLVQHI